MQNLSSSARTAINSPEADASTEVPSSTSEFPVRFRFPITWNYLTPANEPAAKPQPTAVKTTVIIGKRLPALAPPAKPVPVPKPAPKQDGQWEMVIPKMARPRRPSPLRQLKAAITAKPEPSGPEVSFYTLSESFLPGRKKLALFTAVVVAAIGLILWIHPGSSRSPSADDILPSGGWSRHTAYTIGSKEPRQIVVYDPSADAINYAIEFTWIPDTTGVGLMYRAHDSANYYASKIRLLQAGVAPTASVEHFIVSKGVEGTHSRKVVQLVGRGSAIPVKLDVSGPSSTLYLNATPADYWTDERFESGALGFFEDRGEQPVVQTLRFTLFKKSGFQTVYTSLR